MKTVIGRVLDMDPSGKSFTVVATHHDRRGGITSQQHTVRVSRGHQLLLEGQAASRHTRHQNPAGRYRDRATR